MDLSHEVRGSGRRASGGLAAVVLGSAIGVGSMSGCGAMVLGGAAYLAAEEIAQSNVEAARIRADNGKRLTQEEFRRELDAIKKELEPKVIACNYIDASLDGDASSVSYADVVGKRTGESIVFRSDEPIHLAGWGLRDYDGRTSVVKLVDDRGTTLRMTTSVIQNKGGVVHEMHYNPNELPRGHYKFMWMMDTSLLNSLDVEVRDASSVLTQK